MKIYDELESLGFFEWLSETHNLKDTDMTPECLNELLLDDIHRTVCNSVAFRWFREKYGLEHKIIRDSYGCRYQITKVTRTSMEEIDCKGQLSNTSYDEAELECLKKLIEIVKKQK